MCSGFVFWELADNSGWPWPLALCLGCGAGAVFNWLIHVLMRPLKQASNLTRVVVTLSVLVVVQGIMGLHWAPTNTYPVNRILPAGSVSLGGTSIGRDRLMLIGVALALTVGVSVVYRYTRIGLATSAVAENKQALATLGWSPDRVAGLNWAVAGALSAFATIMLIPITGLSVGLSTELLLPALAAAVVGSFTSFPLTFVGALIVGIAQGEIQRFGSSINGLGDAVPFAVILLIVAIRGRALPHRAFVAERLPKVTKGLINWRKLVFWFIVIAVALQWLLPSDWVSAFTATITGAVILMSIVAITGFAGQISLGQWAIAGCGGLITAHLIAAGVPDWAAVVLGLLAAVPIGMIMGTAALRARGMALAIATLAFGICLGSLVLQNQSLNGGPAGILVGNFTLFGLDLDAVSYPGRFAVFCLIVLTLVGLGLANIRRGVAGRRLLAVRANERGAAALGLNVFAAKLTAFCYASVIASLGGILITLRFPSALFTTYDTFTSITLISYAVTGGVGFITGSVVGSQGQAGGVGTQLLSYISTNDLQYLTIVFGVLSLLIIVRAPDGIVELQRRQNEAIRRRIFKILPAGRTRLLEPRWHGAPLVMTAAEPSGALARRSTVLEANDLTVVFGSVRAVHNVSFRLDSGEVLGVIGPNGAGKTTMIDAVTGFVPLAGGSITLDGEDLTRRSVRARARHGLARSFQSLELFEDLSVQENILAACDNHSWLRWITDVAKPARPVLSPIATAAVHELGLTDDLARQPSELPYGKRRLLAIARAIAAGPKVLMLDEPAAGLDEAERSEIVQTIRRLATDWGMAVLLIEHDVALVSAVSDTMIALDFGAVVASGDPAAVRSSPEVVTSYLGLSEDELDPVPGAEPDYPDLDGAEQEAPYFGGERRS